MSSTVRFIAHRGYSRLHPENTGLAFQAALDYGDGTDRVAGIELDVQLSADEQIVVFHDDNLMRMCGRKLEVAQTSYAELLATARQAAPMRGEAIPLFAETLRQVNHRKIIYCEIKAADYDFGLMTRELAALVEDYAPAGDIVLHSFSTDLMGSIIPLTEHLRVKYGFLFDDIAALRAVPAELLSRLDYLHPWFGRLLEHAGEIFAYGKPINTWTVDRREDLKRILALEQADLVEGIMTNDLSIMD
jgi:glycerophosphoryl diester phosphodiesterase